MRRFVYCFGSDGSWEGLWGPLLGIRTRYFECMRRRFLLRYPKAQSPQGPGAGALELNLINEMLRFGTWFGFGWFMGGAVGTVAGFLV